jgi:hypothetical protein
MKIGLTWIERLLLRMFCVAGLVMLGFAHQVPAAGQSLAHDQVSAYSLPDGSTPTLCLPAATDHVDHSDHRSSRMNCEACRLTASMLPAAPAETVGISTSFEEIDTSSTLADARLPRLFPPQICPRGPPDNTIA